MKKQVELEMRKDKPTDGLIMYQVKITLGEGNVCVLHYTNPEGALRHAVKIAERYEATLESACVADYFYWGFVAHEVGKVIQVSVTQKLIYES